MKILFPAFILIVLVACRKDGIVRNYTIQGKILESYSHPIPVSNYTIAFVQSTIFGFFGSTPGLDTAIKTSEIGTFKLSYVSEGNTRDIFLMGADSLQFLGLNPFWSKIMPNTNVDLGTVYLYKQIDTLVRKVQFDMALEVNEQLEVITSNTPSYSYKTLIGPITKGSIVTVDTILNCRLADYFIAENRYRFLMHLSRTSYSKDLYVQLEPGDEKYREIMIIY